MSNLDSPQHANDRVENQRSFEQARFTSCVNMANAEDVRGTFKNRGDQDSVLSDGQLSFSNPYGSAYDNKWQSCNQNFASEAPSSFSTDNSSQSTSDAAQFLNGSKDTRMPSETSEGSPVEDLRREMEQLRQDMAQLTASFWQDFGGKGSGSGSDAQAATTGQPAIDSIAPTTLVSSTSSPGDATIVPTSSPSAPSDATISPAASPSAPSDATISPAASPSAPSDATISPAASPSAPSDATISPAASPSAPSDATISPAASPSAPSDTTISPAASPSAPSDATASNASSTSSLSSPATISSTTDSHSGFAIQNGQLRFNGALLSGVAVTGQYAEQVGPQQLAQTLETDFPGINVVRLATSPEGGAFTQGQPLQGGETVANINATVQALNADGIGVILDDHGSDANTQNNVSEDGNEAAWDAQIAAANLNNPGLMFQTENEPIGSNSAIVGEQQAAYSAIRATGSNAVVAFDLEGGGSAAPMESDTAAYDADSNYAIDAHAYASTNPNPASATAAEVAQTSNLTEANGGAVPVYIGETGNSIDGSNIDAAATAQLNTDWTDGTGAVTWLFDGAATGFGSGNGADHLTNSDGSLTAYGQEVQGLIAQRAT